MRVVNWEEMELNQYLYMQGEVAKFFRKPQGPDSGFAFYTDGRQAAAATSTPAPRPIRWTSLATSSQPQPPGTKLLPTGLPVFKLGYANDDAGERRLGTDSRLMFTAPADGEYLVRVTDTRGAGGDRFGYRLSIRPPQARLPGSRFHAACHRECGQRLGRGVAGRAASTGSRTKSRWTSKIFRPGSAWPVRS